MAWRYPLRILFVLLLLDVSAHAGDPKVSYPPVPAWVNPISWSPFTNSPDTPKSEGTRYLLYEEQDRPKSSERFLHTVQLMENDNGVQDSGSLSISFDPAFEELWLHKVVIHRHGKIIDRLNQSKVKVIQQEPGLGENVFTGEQNAVLFVEDLRVGDVLEYSYTIHGANPVLGGHFSARFTVQCGSPIEHEYFRVVWDSKAPLQQRSYLTDPATVKPLADGAEYIWDFNHPAIIAYEDHQPVSFETSSYVELSDFSDWGEVVNWALPLYETNPTNLPPELTEQIAQWRSAGASNEERARLALQFVQDDLRYTGIELGPDSYLPANPVETFQKRYGDCKAKVALLRFILRQMGIESSPALVNSSVREAIAARLPSPFAFDHVILTVNLDGKTVWVDPTYSRQGGNLWNRHMPHYGKALIISPGIKVLADVPVRLSEQARLEKVTSTLDIKDYHKEVRFTVHTEYFGVDADDMRDQVASTATDELARQYLNYYTRLYPGIKSGQPFKITDDRTANLITAEESYLITNLWVQDDSDKDQTASFFADNLFHILTDPDTRQRKTPLALPYPFVRQQQIIVHLPDNEWEVPALQTNLENKYFSFKYNRLLLHGSTMTYNYECRTKLSVVPPDQVPDYLAWHERLKDLLTDTLQRSDGEAPNAGHGGVNWLTLIIALVVTGFTAAGCIWLWYRLKAANAGLPPLLSQHPEFEGLGGWLILVAIGLFVSPVRRLIFAGENWESYFSMRVWESVAQTSGGAYHPLYAPLLIYEIIINIAMIGLSVLVLCLFFGRRRTFPKVFMAYAWANVLFVVLDEIGSAFIPAIRTSAEGQDHAEAYRTVFYAIIWTLYMLRSRRVKATFVR